MSEHKCHQCFGTLCAPPTIMCPMTIEPPEEPYRHYCDNVHNLLHPESNEDERPWIPAKDDSWERLDAWTEWYEQHNQIPVGTPEWYESVKRRPL